MGRGPSLGEVPRFFNREVFDKVGLEDPRCIYCEDIDLNARLLLDGVSRTELKDTYIIHDENTNLKAILYKPLFAYPGYRFLQRKWAKVKVPEKRIYVSTIELLESRKRLFNYTIRNPQYGLTIVLMVLMRAFVRKLGSWVYGKY